MISFQIYMQYQRLPKNIPTPAEASEEMSPEQQQTRDDDVIVEEVIEEEDAQSETLTDDVEKQTEKTASTKQVGCDDVIVEEVVEVEDDKAEAGEDTLVEDKKVEGDDIRVEEVVEVKETGTKKKKIENDSMAEEVPEEEDAQNEKVTNDVEKEGADNVIVEEVVEVGDYGKAEAGVETSVEEKKVEGDVIIVEKVVEVEETGTEEKKIENDSIVEEVADKGEKGHVANKGDESSHSNDVAIEEVIEENIETITDRVEKQLEENKNDSIVDNMEKKEDTNMGNNNDNVGVVESNVEDIDGVIGGAQEALKTETDTGKDEGNVSCVSIPEGNWQVVDEIANDSVNEAADTPKDELAEDHNSTEKHLDATNESENAGRVDDSVECDKDRSKGNDDRNENARISIGDGNWVVVDEVGADAEIEKDDNMGNISSDKGDNDMGIERGTGEKLDRPGDSNAGKVSDTPGNVRESKDLDVDKVGSSEETAKPSGTKPLTYAEIEGLASRKLKEVVKTTDLKSQISENKDTISSTSEGVASGEIVVETPGKCEATGTHIADQETVEVPGEYKDVDSAREQIDAVIEHGEECQNINSNTAQTVSGDESQEKSGTVLTESCMNSVVSAETALKHWSETSQKLAKEIAEAEEDLQQSKITRSDQRKNSSEVNKKEEDMVDKELAHEDGQALEKAVEDITKKSAGNVEVAADGSDADLLQSQDHEVQEVSDIREDLDTVLDNVTGVSEGKDRQVINTDTTDLDTEKESKDLKIIDGENDGPKDSDSKDIPENSENDSNTKDPEADDAPKDPGTKDESKGDSVEDSEVRYLGWLVVGSPSLGFGSWGGNQRCQQGRYTFSRYEMAVALFPHLKMDEKTKRELVLCVLYFAYTVFPRLDALHILASSAHIDAGWSGRNTF